ncbi:MAG: AAA family ATPase [Wujia sp.]
MSDIRITLFQTPLITLDGQVIHFPYKKAEAFFYFMAIEKKSTREYVTELLWEDNDEILAKKNLRHALYTINKLFPEPLILSPQKSTLIFSDSPDITIDYDAFCQDESSINSSGLLLEGFYVKDCVAFEEWLDDKQAEISHIYSTRLRKQLYTRNEDLSLEDIERIAELCLKDDPLDEKIYKYMMEFYRDNKQYHKAINLYQDLTKVLDEDLGLSPSKDITTLYHKLLDLWIADSSDDESVQPNIRIRDSKLACLSSAFESFMNGKPENFIVIGENGIGKTYLVNSFIESADLSDTLLIQVTCFQAERKYLLQPWNTIFLKLTDYIIERGISVPANYIEVVENFLPTFSSGTPDEFNNTLSYRSFQNALLKIFQIVCHHTRILLFIDNINAMDSISLEILSSLISLCNTNLMVLLTSLDIMSYDLTTFVSSMVRAKYLTQLILEPLTLEQTRFFVQDSLPEITLTDEEVERFYNISAGNIFFLVELINNIKCHHDINCLSKNAKEILNDRLNGVTPDTRKLLDIIALFEHQTPYLVLERLCSNASQLLDNIEEAKELALIREFRDKNDIYFAFHYHQMRDFIYDKIPPSKLRILHNRAALALEDGMKNSGNRKMPYRSLAYHFELGENHQKALYYRLMYMEQISGIYFELYPVLDDSIIADEEISLPEDVDASFQQLYQELMQLKNSNDTEIYNEMEARFYHAKSRYLVLICDYEEATSCIAKALNNPYTLMNTEFHLALLKQMIYYCIQTCNLAAMKNYLDDGLRLAEQADDLAEQAIYLRLYGYYHALTGDRKQSIAALLRSINLLEKSSLKPEIYFVNIAAAYNYLGELSLRYGELDSAIEHFNKAINICAEKGYTVNATFYTNLGKTLFFQGRLPESRAAFVNAHQVYRHSTAIVGCATMHAFLAYFASISGELEHASHHTRVCRRMIERINSPYEKGLYYFIMYKLAEKEDLAVPFITRPAEYYREECRKHIAPYNDPYLLSLLADVTE